MWNKLLIVLIVLTSTVLRAQEKDAGMWLGTGVSGQFTKKLEVGIAPEIRLDWNMSRLSSYFTDINAQYRLKKKLAVQLTYRIGGRNSGDYFLLRQRLQFGFQIREKWDDWSLSWSPRWQAGIVGAGSESDADFVTTMRNKFKLQYSGLKKLDLSMSYEFFHSTTLYGVPEWQNWRWITQAQYSVSKESSVSLGYLIQRDLTESPQEMDFVILASYQWSIDFRKKKDDDQEKSTHEPN